MGQAGSDSVRNASNRRASATVQLAMEKCTALGGIMWRLVPCEIIRANVELYSRQGRPIVWYFFARKGGEGGFIRDLTSSIDGG